MESSYYNLDEIAQVFNLEPTFIQQDIENGKIEYSTIDGEKQISLYELKHYFKTQMHSNASEESLTSENLSLNER